MTEIQTVGRMLTVTDLERVGASKKQTDKFRELFGAEVLVTVELAAQHAGDFDSDWAAKSLLSAAAWATYDTATTAAWATYDAATAAAWATYDAATAAAWATYDAATAAARVTCDAATAAAWADAFIQDAKK